jgi:hypothetical protein
MYSPRFKRSAKKIDDSNESLSYTNTSVHESINPRQNNIHIDSHILIELSGSTIVSAFKMILGFLSPDVNGAKGEPTLTNATKLDPTADPTETNTNNTNRTLYFHLYVRRRRYDRYREKKLNSDH